MGRAGLIRMVSNKVDSREDYTSSVLQVLSNLVARTDQTRAITECEPFNQPNARSGRLVIYELPY